jgi:hypothetical protein
LSSTHTYDFIVLTSLTHPRKILLVVLQIRKAKDLSATLRTSKTKKKNTEEYFFIIYLVCEAVGTAATRDLLCQPRVIVKMIVDNQMECRLAGETEVLGENLPQRHFCPSQNPT